MASNPDHKARARFIETWKRCGGSPVRVAEALGIAQQNVYGMRARLARDGVFLTTIRADGRTDNSPYSEAFAYNPRADETVKGASVIVFGDAHYWPGSTPLAHEAMLRVIKEVKPALIIANGDIFDGAKVSRHEPLGWQKLPSVVEELDAVKTRLGEIERAAPKARKRYTVGNHCSRFDRRLAENVDQFDGVKGFRLQDHIAAWPMSYSVMLNEEAGHPVMVKHVFRGGIHAVYNNTLHAGISIVTGHLHAQLCRPFTDYRGTRYGVDHGCLADVDHASFSYTMDGPVNWRSGFACLTFDEKGRLLPPELAEVQCYPDHRRVVFRGRVIAERKMRGRAAV